MPTKTSALMIVTMALSGCVGLYGVMGEHLNAYEGPERDSASIATIIEHRERPYSVRSFVQEVDGVSYGGPFIGYPQIVKVLPGTHRIVAHCSSGTDYASPATTAVFNSGKTYEIICHHSGKRQISVRIQEAL